jgi:peptidoglycan hydrolase-like protein with peptidoglycan-binding domain
MSDRLQAPLIGSHIGTTEAVMPRDFFKPSQPGGISVSGSVITDVQASLNAMTTSDITVDGIFGRQTKDALLQFQKARGLPETGTVSDTVWPPLMRTTEPSIFERCLQVTASFEGTGFQLIEGNFDGAGLTWGIIGFTLMNGELGAIMAEINAQSPDIMAQTFGHDADFILKISGPESGANDKLAFANSISGPEPQYRVVEPWRTYFSDLGINRQVQRLQVQRARAKYWTDIALRDAKDLGFIEELDLLLLFDVAVQDGGMRSKGRLAAAQSQLKPEMNAAQRRHVVAQVVADSIAGSFREDVLRRKMCIATGDGIVHGSNYSLDSWGFLDGFAPSALG